MNVLLRPCALLCVCICALVMGVTADVQASTVLEVGAPLPSLEFEDIHGVEASSGHYDARIQVITFADRESSDQLMAWMLKAAPEVMVRHPSLKVAYLGFADLQSVPSLFEHIVYPALKLVNARSEESMENAYRDHGITLRPESIAYHLTPDWEGQYLEKFGLQDASSFHCFVVQDGTIVAHFDNQEPNVGQRYIALMDRLMRPKQASKPTALSVAKL